MAYTNGQEIRNFLRIVGCIVLFLYLSLITIFLYIVCFILQKIINHKYLK